MRAGESRGTQVAEIAATGESAHFAKLHLTCFSSNCGVSKSSMKGRGKKKRGKGEGKTRKVLIISGELI